MLTFGLLLTAQTATEVKPGVEFPGKYQLAGNKIKITATFPRPAVGEADDFIELRTSAGEKASVTQALGPQVTTEMFGAGQKRTVEWMVPEIPNGSAEIFWKCGEQVVGPATISVMKKSEPIDWDKADVAALEKVAVLMDTDQGQMLLGFFPNKAPNTVRNFLKLTNKGFYNGLGFHRIIKGFMIQGGDPEGDGSGGPGYSIKAEFNDTPHKRGVISMARSQDPNSAGSQFFIVHGAHAEHLDNQYTAFGKLIDGFETLDKIANAPVRGDKAVNKPIMKQVTIVERPAGAN